MDLLVGADKCVVKRGLDTQVARIEWKAGRALGGLEVAWVQPKDWDHDGDIVIEGDAFQYLKSGLEAAPDNACLSLEVLDIGMGAYHLRLLAETSRKKPGKLKEGEERVTQIQKRMYLIF